MTARRPGKVREVARTPAETRGAEYRLRRSALGLSPLQLGLPPFVAFRLPWVEDGVEPPPDDYPWERLDARLGEALERVVGQHIDAGGRWQDVLLPGWAPDEIRNAALTWEASRG